MTKGCYTCRRRRIVCDNGLPTCRKCRDAGKECLGYQKPLVWVKGGVASRGRMMGLTFDDVAVDSPHGQSSHDRDDLALDTTPQPSPKPANEERQLQRISPSSLQSPQAAPSWVLVDPLYQDMDRTSRLYITHFSQWCAPDLALYDGVKNPYRGLIPFVEGAPVLTETLAAVGALHYAYLSSNNKLLRLRPPRRDSLDTDSGGAQHECLPLSLENSSVAYEHFLSLKQQALRSLSLNISDESLRHDDRTVASILVLILLDVIESGNGAWKYHLEGAKNLLKSRQDTNAASMGRVIEELDTFIVDNCLVMEIMGSTLARPGTISRPFFSQSMGATVLQRLEKTSWVGCPAYLLEVIFFLHAQNYSDGGDLHSLSFLRSASDKPRPPISGAMTTKEKAETILHHIYAFKPFDWAEEMQSTLFLPDLSKRIALASAYKAGVYLYAQRVFSSSSCQMGKYCVTNKEKQVDIHKDGEPSICPKSRTFEGCTLPPYSRRQASADLIKHLSVIPYSDEHFKCTIWLTFIAGAEATTPQQRQFTLERLDILWNTIVSVNVQNAAEVLKLMWHKRDEWQRARKGQRQDPAAYGNKPTEEDLMDETSETPTTINDDDTDDTDDGFNWIRELDRSRTDWLFI